jgi:antitoxin component of RelBE/YafQ-DinJ toxin-antitoxin module
MVHGTTVSMRMMMSRTSIRLDDELEQAAREKCHRLDLNLSQVVRQLLRQWLAEEQEEADFTALEEHQELEKAIGARDEVAAWLR